LSRPRHFILVEDRPIEAERKRWVVVAPPGSSESRVLLARAVGPEQSARVGDQTGGRVFLFPAAAEVTAGPRPFEARR